MNWKYAVVLIVVVTLSACRNEPLRREYQEAVFEAPAAEPRLPPGHPSIGSDMNDPAMKAMIADSAVEAPIIWETPDGWTEIPGDGMRLATLKSPDGLVQISIISFGGQAGGVEGNVVRWLGQLNITLDDQALKNFIADSESVSSTGGFNVRIFRLTSLAPDADSSMIAAMTEIPGAIVFFKMTGPAKNLEAHFPDFHDFCQSLELKS